MKPLAFILLLGLSVLAEAADTVLVVSIDALHPAALSAKTSPTLHALMQPGRYTLQGRSVEPPKTLIGHTAMLTGLPPQQNGKRDNEWQPGEPRVAKPTFFDDARRAGYRTAYYYSKPKLGYLVNAAVGEHGLEPHAGIERVRERLAAAPGAAGVPRLTVSIGLTERRAGEDVAQALERADQAVYEAKAQGRDRVVVA